MIEIAILIVGIWLAGRLLDRIDPSVETQMKRYYRKHRR